MWRSSSPTPAIAPSNPQPSRGLLDCIAHLIDTGYGGRIAKRYLTELRVASTIGP